jgi:hypothetical protein
MIATLAIAAAARAQGVPRLSPRAKSGMRHRSWPSTASAPFMASIGSQSSMLAWTKAMPPRVSAPIALSGEP